MYPLSIETQMEADDMAATDYAFTAEPVLRPMRSLADKVDDAFAEYVRENDALTASDYRAEGYALAEAAFDMPAEDRDDWIDGETYAFPGSARYLVAVAADYRLAEMVRADVYPFSAEAA